MGLVFRLYPLAFPRPPPPGNMAHRTGCPPPLLPSPLPVVKMPPPRIVLALVVSQLPVSAVHPTTTAYLRPPLPWAQGMRRPSSSPRGPQRVLSTLTLPQAAWQRGMLAVSALLPPWQGSRRSPPQRAAPVSSSSSSNNSSSSSSSSCSSSCRRSSTTLLKCK